MICFRGLFSIWLGFHVLVWRQGQYQNDLHGLTFQAQGGIGTISGDYLLTQVFQIDTNRSKWWDLSVILAMVFIYRIIFFCMIKANEDITPWVRGYLARRILDKKKASVYASARQQLTSPGNMSPVRESISAATQQQPTTWRVHTHAWIPCHKCHAHRRSSINRAGNLFALVQSHFPPDWRWPNKWFSMQRDQLLVLKNHVGRRLVITGSPRYNKYQQHGQPQLHQSIWPLSEMAIQ